MEILASVLLLFSLHSGSALVTVVGVLVEVPVMLSLVALANRTQHWFAEWALDLTVIKTLIGRFKMTD